MGWLDAVGRQSKAEKAQAAMSFHRTPCFSSRFWASPINISGLERESVASLFERDLFDLLMPTLAEASEPGTELQVDRKAGPVWYGDLHDVVEGRVGNLTRFLREVSLTIEACPAISAGIAPLRIHALSGDSHNGGKRPLVLETPKARWVLKFADPRPYQLVADILSELSGGIGSDLNPPTIIADREHNWYLIPYLEPEEKGCSGDDVEAFMFAVGTLTAVAYCLRMVDLHLENLVVFRGKPIIVDPECLLYNFGQHRNENCLLSTGLLSHNPMLSALRGGDLSKQKIVQISLCECSDGTLDYYKPALPFRNRFRGSNGQLADPVEHRRTLLDGFTAAFEWFLENDDLVSDILAYWVTDDFRIRYLVRKTRLYITTIHMLNLPVSCSYETWINSVFMRFRLAGHFPEEITEDVVSAEWNDMAARDVPYFWVNAGESVIRHRTGPKQKLSLCRNAREQAIYNVQHLTRSDMVNQIRVLSDFLETDLYIDGECNTYAT